jgi:hypothetical protein
MGQNKTEVVYKKRSKKVFKNVKKNSRTVFIWVKPRWRKLALLIIQIFAAVSVILGWYLDHGNQSGWVVPIFAPQYSDTSNFSDNLFVSLDSEFDDSTPGFLEVADLLCESQLSDLGDCTIVRLKVIGMTAMVVSFDPTVSGGPEVVLQVDLRDGRRLPKVPIPKSVLQSEIRNRFLEQPLFWWGEGLQWVGVLITFAILIIERAFTLK